MQIMRNLAATVAVALILPLAGCGNKIDTERKTVASIDTAVTSGIDAAFAYASLDRCSLPEAPPPPACSDQAIVDEVNDVAHDASDAVDEAWAVVEDPAFNPDDATWKTRLNDAVIAARAALNLLNTVLLRHGLQAINPDLYLPRSA